MRQLSHLGVCLSHFLFHAWISGDHMGSLLLLCASLYTQVCPMSPADSDVLYNSVLKGLSQEITDCGTQLVECFLSTHKVSLES